MPRKPDVNYVSLNHIRDALFPDKDDRKTGASLIFQFLPPWGGIWKESEANEAYKKSIDNFCGGNAKQKDLHNAEDISRIISRLKAGCAETEDSYIRQMFQLLDRVTEAIPKLTPEHDVFQLSYVTKKDALEGERRKFASVHKAILQLKIINTEKSLKYALFLLVILGVIRHRITEVPEICDLALMRRLYPQLVPDLSRYPEALAMDLVTDTHAPSNAKDSPAAPRRTAIGGTQFIQNALAYYAPSEIKSIEMAFHGGEHWLLDAEKKEIFRQIEKNNIPLRILINSEEAMRNIWRHTSRGDLAPGSLERAKINWQTCQTRYPKTMNVCVSDIPLLHRMYMVRFKNGTGSAHVSLFVYGPHTRKNTVQLVFNASDPEYAQFAEEFDYLWAEAEKARGALR